MSERQRLQELIAQKEKELEQLQRELDEINHRERCAENNDNNKELDPDGNNNNNNSNETTNNSKR